MRDTILALSPIAYWMLAEASGLTAECEVNSAQDGTHANVTLGETGIGDGRTCPLYDGSTSYTDITSATLMSAFDGAAGSMLVWFKVHDVGVWTDLEFGLAFALFTNADNRIYLFKSSSENMVGMSYHAGGTAQHLSKTELTELGWMAVGLTWDKVADEVKAYYNGVWEETGTGLGTWVGALVSATLGAYNDTPDYVTDGWVAHAAVWDRVLTPTEVASLYDAGTGYLAGAVGASQCRLGMPSDDIDEYVYNLFDLVRDSYWRYPS